MKKLVLVLMMLGMAGCSTITITAKDTPKLRTEPTFKARQSFFLAGLIGEHTVDVKAVCGKNEVVQVQTVEDFMDRFLGVVTLTIYSPRTVKVWCAEGGKKS